MILLLFSCSATSGLLAQGIVGFANNVLQPVVDCRTGMPASGSSGIVVGMYWSPELSGEFTLATKVHGEPAVAPIVGAGVFNNGGEAIGIVGTRAGDEVLIQIRAWSGGYSSFEEAIASMDPNVVTGVSDLIGPIMLAGVGPPSPNLVIQGGFQGFVVGDMTCIPEPSSWMLALIVGLGRWPSEAQSEAAVIETTGHSAKQ